MMRRFAIWAVAAAGFAGVFTAAADVVYLPKGKVDTARMNPGVMTAGEDHKVIMSRRNGPGEAEVHDGETDVFYVVEGAAVFVTGGTVANARTTGPGQIRGSAIEGGKTHSLSVGDVIVIPKGTPHWFKEVPDLVVYYVVKAVTPPDAE